MTSLHRRLASFPLVAALASSAAAVMAFSDENADMKEAAADRAQRRVMAAQAPAPRKTVWVPLATAKQLDGFKPVLPPERARQAGQAQAPQALAAAAVAR
ncbi:hypothetical protein [Roseateles sp. BYS96W]|uniref:Uncharacterized protein n=1 Tax=Pelomonas nitida TaxID=3299027 RepID=A0ABW7G351_9BURK